MSFATKPVLNNFTRKKFFTQSEILVTFYCQIILEEAIFENEINLGLHYNRKQ